MFYSKVQNVTVDTPGKYIYINFRRFKQTFESSNFSIKFELYQDIDFWRDI